MKVLRNLPSDRLDTSVLDAPDIETVWLPQLNELCIHYEIYYRTDWTPLCLLRHQMLYQTATSLYMEIVNIIMTARGFTTIDAGSTVEEVRRKK